MWRIDHMRGMMCRVCNHTWINAMVTSPEGPGPDQGDRPGRVRTPAMSIGLPDAGRDDDGTARPAAGYSSHSSGTPSSGAPNSGQPSLNPIIHTRLTTPALTGGFDLLGPVFTREVIHLRCAAPAGLEDGPWMGAAVRGALGRVLEERAANGGAGGRPDPFNRPSAFAILFQTQAMLTRRLEVPRPWRLRVQRRGRGLTIEIALYGFAGYWAPAVADALVEALAAGVSLRAQGRMRVPWPVEALEIRRITGLPLPPDTSRALVLDIETPLALKAGGALAGHLDNLPMMLADRASGLARWHDIAITADFSALRTASRRLRIQADGLVPDRWERRSGRLAGRIIPMAGFRGRLVLQDLDPAFALPLAIAADAHLGQGATAGLGWFSVSED
jgi:hypothetical protein